MRLFGLNHDKKRRRGFLDRLVQDNPQFHAHQGQLTSWAPHVDTLRFLFSQLSPSMTTLETGCGQTTVVFAIAGTRHVSVMPSAEEAERVRQYCAAVGLVENVTFVLESSDIALARNGLVPDALDVVFIDGAHAFPAPVLDWHYTARKLRTGGLLGVDDYKMPSVRVLYDFLRHEDEWELLKISQNTVFFRKRGEPRDLVDWSGQKINAGFRGW
jgi:Methyltransferase domain